MTKKKVAEIENAVGVEATDEIKMEAPAPETDVNKENPVENKKRGPKKGGTRRSGEDIRREKIDKIDEKLKELSERIEKLKTEREELVNYKPKARKPRAKTPEKQRAYYANLFASGKITQEEFIEFVKNITVEKVTE